MPTNHRQGATAVITVDCPWCESAAEVQESELTCPHCNVTVAIATELHDPALAAAA